MEIRRRTGTRQPRPPVSVTQHRWPRRLIANACFRCCVSFKRRPLEAGRRPHTCPNCGGDALKMGRSFKAPKRSDLKQWRKVELLWTAGYRFWGRSKAPPLPARRNAVEAFIRANPRHPNRLPAYWT